MEMEMASSTEQAIKNEIAASRSKNCSLSKKIIYKINDNELRGKSWRVLIAYWILGLCNNYGYVVMLTAAQDILHEQNVQPYEEQKNDFKSSNLHTERQCNKISTGAILLADILPCLLIKCIVPFLPFFVHVRVATCALLQIGGLLMVAFSQAQWMAIVGVILTSLSSGLGEVTFLQYSARYDKDVVSTWSSGTGGAGIVGAISYTGLTKFGPRNALLIMLIVPALMALTFWVILTKPSDQFVEQTNGKKNKLTFYKKLVFFPKLLKYMIPLGFVYLFEYFINQGLTELIQFDNIFLTTAEQYRWLQVDYQIGVFISRSSVNILHVKHIWLMALLQMVNVILFTTEAIFFYIPSFWIVITLTLWEGLLGGAAYVNTFYRIPTEVHEDYAHFAMGTTSFADSIGITLAGVLAIFAHNKICELPPHL